MGKNKKNEHYDIIVIGAGAAGITAAITAARNQKNVLLIDKVDKIGKKIYATGNGKCNFTNQNMLPEFYHGNLDFINHVLNTFSVKDCLAFFRSIGIYPKEKNGYFYPNSEQAASVACAFESELNRLQVSIALNTKVTNITSGKNITVYTAEDVYTCQNLIIATGLLASPKLGSDGSLFDAIKALGHRFSPVLPALCGFYCKGISFKKTAGVRAHGTVKAIIDKQIVAEDTGEIQFNEYGLSGIPVFQISHFLSKALYEKRSVEISMNLLPELSKEALKKELEYRKTLYTNENCSFLFNGLLHQKLIEVILDKANISPNYRLASLSSNQIEQLAEIIQNLTVTVTNYRDFEFAQVCTGGIPIQDIHMKTLESKHASHVYFAGEILDVDGICGGYNLHFAWATGMIAGRTL